MKTFSETIQIDCDVLVIGGGGAGLSAAITAKNRGHPARISAVAGLSVPYRSRLDGPAIDFLRKIYQDKFFYQIYFQKEGVAEAELEADVRTSLRKIYYSISGDVPNLDSWLQRNPTETLLEAFDDPDPFPAWLSEADLNYFIENFLSILNQATQ